MLGAVAGTKYVPILTIYGCFPTFISITIPKVPVTSYTINSPKLETYWDLYVGVRIVRSLRHTQEQSARPHVPLPSASKLLNGKDCLLIELMLQVFESIRSFFRINQRNLLGCPALGYKATMVLTIGKQTILS